MQVILAVISMLGVSFGAEAQTNPPQQQPVKKTG